LTVPARWGSALLAARRRLAWSGWRAWPRPDGQRVLRVGGGAVLVAVVLVAAVTTARDAWTSTREDTERTTASLESTRADIARTEDDLAAAEDQRDTARQSLGDQVAALATRQDQRDDAQDGLDLVTLALVQAQDQLTASQADLEMRKANLDAFNRCLVGVAQALNQAAVSDTDGLLRTIRGIEGVCTTAGVVL
jgi:septal ring factor EnvC (AmiA/AmiB activator)